MKRLIIIGAGGFGREVLVWAQESAAFGREWEIGGFLDDRPDALASFGSSGFPMLGNTIDYQPRPSDVFVIAMGQVRLRRLMWERFCAKGADFTRVIHRSCTIGPRVQLGDGVILCPGVVLTCDLSIGNNTALNVMTAVGHDARIGDHCQLSSFCDITGFVEVGDGVFMGSRASIIPGKRVGDDAVVGAGSVVIRNVPSRTTVFGNPARPILLRE